MMKKGHSENSKIQSILIQTHFSFPSFTWKRG